MGSWLQLTARRGCCKNTSVSILVSFIVSDFRWTFKFELLSWCGWCEHVPLTLVPDRRTWSWPVISLCQSCAHLQRLFNADKFRSSIFLYGLAETDCWKKLEDVSSLIWEASSLLTSLVGVETICAKGLNGCYCGLDFMYGCWGSSAGQRPTFKWTSM